MELRESSTSDAVRRCCGSRTSSFRIKHTVFSETRPSLGERARGEAMPEAAAGGHAGSTARSPHHPDPESPGLTEGWSPVPAAQGPSHLCPSSATTFLVSTAHHLCSHYCCDPWGLELSPFSSGCPGKTQNTARAHTKRKGSQDGLYSLRDGVLGSLDLAEELLRYAVVEGELAVEHGEEHHAQRPHVTGLSAVRPSCGETKATALGHRSPPQPTSSKGTDATSAGDLFF